MTSDSRCRVILLAVVMTSDRRCGAILLAVVMTSDSRCGAILLAVVIKTRSSSDLSVSAVTLSALFYVYFSLTITIITLFFALLHIFLAFNLLYCIVLSHSFIVFFSSSPFYSTTLIMLHFHCFPPHRHRFLVSSFTNFSLFSIPFHCLHNIPSSFFLKICISFSSCVLIVFHLIPSHFASSFSFLTSWYSYICIFHFLHKL